MSRRRRTLLAVLAALVILAIQPSRTVTGQPTGGTLYIVFLPGLCGWAGADPYCHNRVDAVNRARGTFGVFRAALVGAHIPYHGLYYSYDPGHPNSYTINDTHQSVARSVDSLERLLRGAARKDPTATFDLVGYSLGGVVAASWAVTNGRDYGYDATRGLLGRIHSIVTFDSPLHGIHSDLVGNQLVRMFGGPVWYSLQPNAETIKEINYPSAQWWALAAHLHTVANTADRVVPAPEAELGDKRVVTDNQCPQDLFIFSTCHGAVMQDKPLNRWVACHWITTPYQCAAVTPTPSPTPSPSPIPTPRSTPAGTPTIVVPSPPTEPPVTPSLSATPPS